MDTKNLKAEHEQQNKTIEHLEMEKELFEEREECRESLCGSLSDLSSGCKKDSDLDLFKDIGTYKNIGNKLNNGIKLDQNEKQTLMHHGRIMSSHGMTLQKRDAIYIHMFVTNNDGVVAESSEVIVMN